ncbi:hypothetical protein ACFVXC_20615 [Streptomyces sp. NPDC058257]|uniref:hypothetical protein n=1 Tax=Streptomyces sp. NPDC058257 TaxID=3346409 RepID=UPI0036EAA61A
MTAPVPPRSPEPENPPEPEKSPEPAAQPAPGEYRELPSGEQMRIWNDLVSDSAERMLSLVEQEFQMKNKLVDQRIRDAEHNRRLDLVNVWFRAAGLVTGMVLGAGGIVGYLWIAKYCVDHGAAGAGAGLLGGGVAALAAVITAVQRRNGS